MGNLQRPWPSHVVHSIHPAHAISMLSKCQMVRSKMFKISRANPLHHASYQYPNNFIYKHSRVKYGQMTPNWPVWFRSSSSSKTVEGANFLSATLVSASTNEIRLTHDIPPLVSCCRSHHIVCWYSALSPIHLAINSSKSIYKSIYKLDGLSFHTLKKRLNIT